MRKQVIIMTLTIICASLWLSGVRGDDEPKTETPDAGRNARTLTCVKSYGAFSTPKLNTSNVMSTWKDKKGYLYLALKADSKKNDNGTMSYTGGGIAIISPDNKAITLTGKTRPCFLSNTIIHAWGDDDGKIYVSTCYNGLVIIDTKNTPMDTGDDTATQYCLNGVFDTTEGGEPKLLGRSPCLGSDLVLHSCMDPETKDLFISAGNYYLQKERTDTYEGGFITLQWDKEKKAYVKSYTYRTFNWQFKKGKKKFYHKGIYDTTEAFNVEKNAPRGGKRIKKLFDFGGNHNCHYSCYDARRGLIYIARRDTLGADLESIPGYNGDGGITIIDTKKTRDPIDDMVRELNTRKKPTICGSFVSHVWVDDTTGNAFVSVLALLNLDHGGVTVISMGDNKSTSFLNSGIYDTSKSRIGIDLDDKNMLRSPAVHFTVKYPSTGETLVMHSDGIDIISKDLKKITSIPLSDIRKLPNAFGEEGLWVTDAWVDKEGLIYVSTGEGKNGLLVLKLADTKK